MNPFADMSTLLSGQIRLPSSIPKANRIVSPKMIYSAHKICTDRRRAGGVFLKRPLRLSSPSERAYLPSHM